MKKDETLNYGATVSELKKNGPQRLYLLWGPEDYLREQFLSELKKACLPEGEGDFSYKRMDGPDIDPAALQNAVDSVPFMTERTLVELRGVDLNKVKDAMSDAVAKVLSDIPDYCTVVFVQGGEYEPDGRLKLIKSIRKSGREVKFTAQNQGMLENWVKKRFAALDKNIDGPTAQHLIFVSGTLMTRLIPEIEKVAAFAQGQSVTKADIEAVAHHIPEARVFDMTDCIAARDTDAAARILAELLGDKDNDPIMLLAVIGRQMRQLYAARLATDRGLGRKFVEDNCGIRFSFQVDKLMRAARGYSIPALERAVELCCETDTKMKSTGEDDTALLKDAVMRIAAGETNGKN